MLVDPSHLISSSIVLEFRSFRSHSSPETYHPSSDSRGFFLFVFWWSLVLEMHHFLISKAPPVCIPPGESWPVDQLLIVSCPAFLHYPSIFFDLHPATFKPSTPSLDVWSFPNPSLHHFTKALFINQYINQEKSLPLINRTHRLTRLDSTLDHKNPMRIVWSWMKKTDDCYPRKTAWAYQANILLDGGEIVRPQDPEEVM